MADFDAQLIVGVIPCNPAIRKSNAGANMPSFKPGLKITVAAGKKSFSIGGLRLPDGRYLIKRGRVISRKMPRASISKIFAEARKWAVKNAK